MGKAAVHRIVDDASLDTSDALPVEEADPLYDATAGSDRERQGESRELPALLEKAASAPPDRRIEWRDRIAAHGAQAIEAVQPWLEDSRLAAFAIRVIERAGSNGEPELASHVLRSARAHLPPGMTGDVHWALQHLRAVMRPKPVTPSSAPTPRSPISRRLNTPARPRTRRP